MSENAGNQPAATAPSTDAHVARLIDKYGTAENAVRVLARENKRYRDAAKDAKGAKLEMDAELTAENADLLRENARLTSLIPAAGSVVLTAEQKSEWEAYQALGTAKDVKVKVDRGAQAENDLAEERAKAVIPQAAKELQLNDDALTTFLSDKGLRVEMKDGKPLVRKANDEKATPESLADFLAKPENKPYEPMLRAAKAPSNNNNGSNNNNQSLRQPFPRMGGSGDSKASDGGGNGTGGVIQGHLDRMAQRRTGAVNPLRPATPGMSNS